MPPLASTSRLYPPAPSSSFESSSTIPRRNQLSRKGKEKVTYTPPSYDFDDPSQGLYQPRSGQVQRKKKKEGKSKSSPLAGTSTKKKQKNGRKSTLGVETIKIGSTVEKTQEEKDKGESASTTKKKKKRKRERELSSALKNPRKRTRPDLPEADLSSQPDPITSPSRISSTLPPTTKQKPRSPRKKKTVRLDLPARVSSTSSSSDTDYPPGSENATFLPDPNDSGEGEDEDERPSSYGFPNSSLSSPVRSRRRLRSTGPVASDDAPGSATEGELEAGEELLDYSNPLNLPRTTLGNQQRRTSKKYWRGLEYGVHRSALFDAVAGGGNGENDLAKLVWGWEGIVKETEKEEEQRKGQEGDDEAEGEGGEKEGNRMRKRGRPRLPRLNGREGSRSRSATPQTLRRSARSNAGYSSATLAGDDGEDTEGRTTRNATPMLGAEEEEATLALPSARTLDQMARWPLYPAELIDYSLQIGQRYNLQEELEILAEQTRRRNHQLLRSSRDEPLPRNRRKILSAYSSGGPFASTTRQSSSPDSGSDSLFDSESDSSSSFSTSTPSNYPPSFLQIPTTITSILDRLGDFVPKQPLPALDIWSVKLREEGIKLEKEKEAKKKEDLEDEGEEREKKKRRKRAPGWREVVAVARENESIPRHVVEKLEEQLKEIYGESGEDDHEEPAPVTLPPVGGLPAFPTFDEPRRKKRPRGRTATKESTVDDGTETTIGAGHADVTVKGAQDDRLQSQPNPDPASASHLDHVVGPAETRGEATAMEIDSEFELPIPPSLPSSTHFAVQ
ncbi:hypothetical protein JCM16303_003627 [Sporobolomyces ruberrimus]